MRIRWTGPAARDLTRIVEHIRTDNPEALRTAKTIYTAVASLRKMPYRGRAGSISDTRELVLSPLPYIVVYEIIDNHVQVLRVRHAAQNWP
jgi:toxin ParE1/3/4